ncbi:PAS domain-containing protein [Anaeromicropila herbilytica]|uniref:histidine kinase n=1 Tax=Anaeromicropila herbilytica TaxID=2785025 RepID=A0A7R7IBT7_9FIRM|nr:PAS domain-containing protein [Anaeromicropila herbilytica]BCN29932.1 hypothetical protein bsdtb5_12270 [Anaeromicropila herbilytica]
MRSNIKRYYQEFIDYIDFPTIVYIYETGRILAINEYARGILGYDLKNIKLVWQEQIKHKFNRKLLNNGSQILNNVIIETKGDKQVIDMELNSLIVDKNHIIFCFFELSQKHFFTEHMKNQIPRMIWKDEFLVLQGLSGYSMWDFSIDTKEQVVNRKIFDDEVANKIENDDLEIIQSCNNIYNIMEEFRLHNGDSFFVKLHKMPILNREGKADGIIYVYTQILNKEEKNNLLQTTLQENVILKEVVSKSGTIIVRWNTESNWGIEYISPNIIKYGYDAIDFHSNKILWKDIIHPDDYLRVYNEHMRDNNKAFIEDKPLVLEYRILTSNNDIIWVREESIAFRENYQEYYREGVVNDITYEKELEKELLDNRNVFKIKLDEDYILTNKIFNMVNFWDLIDLEYMKLLQESIENLSGIMNFLVDHKGNILTEIVVRKNLKEDFNQIMTTKRFMNHLKLLTKECMEANKPITRYYYENSLTITILPFVFGEMKVGAWFLVGNTKKLEVDIKPDQLKCISDMKVIAKKSYEKICLYLWSYVKSQRNTILDKLELINEKKKIRETSLKTEKQYEKAKLITKILQLSHLERPYIEVLNNIFNKVASFSEVEKVIIYENVEEDQKLAIQYEWHQGEGLPKGRKNKQIAEKMPYLQSVLKDRGGFVLLYHSDDKTEYNELFLNSKVSAAAIAHLTLNYYNDSIIVFTHSKEKIKWKDEEISLFREIIPIIQNVVVKARETEIMNRNNFTMLEILNNLDEYVLVLSEQDNEILFSNNLVTMSYGSNIIGNQFIEFCDTHQLEIYQLKNNNRVQFKQVEEGLFKCYDHINECYLSMKSKKIQWFDGQGAYLINMKNITNIMDRLKKEYSFLLE